MGGKKVTKIKDLKVKEDKAKQVKGGFNPQPEPPGKAVSGFVVIRKQQY